MQEKIIYIKIWETINNLALPDDLKESMISKLTLDEIALKLKERESWSKVGGRLAVG